MKEFCELTPEEKLSELGKYMYYFIESVAERLTSTDEQTIEPRTFTEFYDFTYGVWHAQENGLSPEQAVINLINRQLKSGMLFKRKTSVK